MVKRFFFALAWIIVVSSRAFAADPLSWIYTGSVSSPQPSWIQQVVYPTDDQTLAELDFDLTPPAANLELLVTVTFTEVPDGFLRILWTQKGQASTLTQNFQEGTNMANRRAILIPKELLQGPGRITFQASTADLKISAIEWSWLQPKTLSVANGKGDVWRAVDAQGHGKTADQLSGEPESPLADSWQKSIVTASISDNPVRIETPVQFAATFLQAPSVTRLEILLAGLPLDTPVRVWINDRDAGLLAVKVPSLEDPGYQHDPAGNITYVGWREASAWIDASLLSAGQNTIQFEPLWGNHAIVPLVVKEFHLQLDYPPTP